MSDKHILCNGPFGVFSMLESDMKDSEYVKFGPDHTANLPATEITSVQQKKSKAVSAAWVLNQLIGMKFPEQGQAYDYMKKCIESDPDLDSEGL